MFGADAEITALAIISQDEDTFDQYHQDVSEHLSYGPAVAVYNALDAVYKKIHRLPSHRELKLLIDKAAVQASWSSLFTTQVVKVYEALVEDRTEISHSLITDFIREKRIKTLKNKIIEMQSEEGLHKINEIIDYLKETQEISLGDEGGTLFFPFSDDYIENPIEKLAEERGEPIFLGIPGVDERTKGMYRGETLMIVAPTGVGKTQLKHQLALNIATNGGKVLYLFNDNTRGEILLRFWCNQCNVDTEMEKSSEVLSADLFRSRGLLWKTLCCDEIFPGKTTVADVKKIIRRAKKVMGDVAAVVLDYSNLLAPSSTYGNDHRLAAKSVIDDLAALAKEENVLMITSTQSNKEGMNADIVTIQNMSEAFAKSWVCAHVWTVSQSLADKEMEIVKLCSVKSRRKVSLYCLTMNQDPVSLRMTQNTYFPVVSLFEAIGAAERRRGGGRRQRVDNQEEQA